MGKIFQDNFFSWVFAYGTGREKVMRNRAAMGVIVLAFVFSSMFWFASCAKKQVDTYESKPKTETGEGSVDKGSAAGKQSSSETITELSEAERRAKQQEIEIANKIILTLNKVGIAAKKLDKIRESSFTGAQTDTIYLIVGTKK